MSRRNPNSARGTNVSRPGPEYAAAVTPTNAAMLEDDEVLRLMLHAVYDDSCTLHPGCFTRALWGWVATPEDYAVLDRKIARIVREGIPGPCGMTADLVLRRLWLRRGWEHGEPVPEGRPAHWFPGDGPVGKAATLRSVRAAMGPRFGTLTEEGG